MGLFHGRVKSSAPNHDSNPNKIYLAQIYLAPNLPCPESDLAPNLEHLALAAQIGTLGTTP